MNQNEKKRQQTMSALCGELHCDDGADPTEFFRKPQQRGNQRKVWQLCRQVRERLDMVFSGQLADPMLLDLTVESVVPAPDASQLAVRLRPLFTDQEISPERAEAIHLRLNALGGFLRSEVAAAITRKRAPRLNFHLQPQMVEDRDAS